MAYPQKFHTVTEPRKGVLHVQFNRPEKLNAMHKGAYTEYGEILAQAGEDEDVRAIVVSGTGRAFTAGLDVGGTSPEFVEIGALEKSRAGLRLAKLVKVFQAAIGQANTIDKPVIGVAHGPSIGLAIDILCAVDVRFAAEDTLFSVREIEIGMAADIGTLQRLPKIVQNLGWVNDICFTGRNFGAKEAKDQGFVQYVYPTKDEAVNKALDYAEKLAAKSPVAMLGTKKSIKYAMDHTVADSLEQIAQFNAYGLGDDFVEGSMAMLSKKKPTYGKL